MLAIDRSHSGMKSEQKRPIRELSIAVTVPDPAWRVSIEEIYIVENELWVISGLQRTSGLAAQMITIAKDTVNINAPMLAIKHYVFGKTWNWKNNEGYIFVDSKNVIDTELTKAEKIYEK